MKRTKLVSLGKGLTEPIFRRALKTLSLSVTILRTLRRISPRFRSAASARSIEITVRLFGGLTTFRRSAVLL